MLVTNNSWFPSNFNEIVNNALNVANNVARNTAATPSINIIERKDAFEMQIAAPGMTREDIKLSLNEDENLVIAIEKKVETAPDKEQEATETKQDQPRYLRREFGLTKFNRTYILPEDVNRDAISATAQDGILTITMPRVLPEELKHEVKMIAIN